MTEDQYIGSLKAAWPLRRDVDAADEFLRLADKAVAEHPGSAALWSLRGDLIQLGSGRTGHDLGEALESYKKAAELAPDDPEHHSDIGFFHDAVEDAPELAIAPFEKAIELGGDAACFAGLARALTQCGRKDDAHRVLESCPYPHSASVHEILAEINDGEWDR